MNIIHYNPHGDKTVADYIDTLNKSMSGQAVCRVVDKLLALKGELSRQHADIVDIHGCWHKTIPFACIIAKHHGARIVVTPHGQLEPWIMKRHWLITTLPRTLSYQHRIIKRAYSVIVMGKMEHDNMEKLCWTPRIETIPCSLFTSSITDDEMARQTLAVFNKVLDSNVLELMDITTTSALHSLYKIYTTADPRWLEPSERETIEKLDQRQWRQIEIYAYNTSTLLDVRHGADALGITLPDCHPSEIACYLPYSHSNENQRQRLASLTADEKGMHNPADVVEMIKALQQKVRKRTLGIADILQFSATLYQLRTDEDEVRYLLDEAKLTRFASSLMQTVVHFTHLPYGFLTVSPNNGRLTRRIMNTIFKQLEI